jgi:5-hydroxyisourate hydrolase
MMGGAVGISTHVLDTAAGLPAGGLPVSLEVHRDDSWVPVGEGVTDADGRVAELAPDGVTIGTYRIRFDTATYFIATRQTGFYPEVTVVFEVTNAARHHHLPLLLSPFGYSTYRGS